MNRFKSLPWKYIFPFIPKLGFVLFLVLLSVGFEAAAPLPFKLLIDNVLGGEKLETHSFLGNLLSGFDSRESLALFTVLAFFLTTLAGSIMEYFVSILTRSLSKNAIFEFSQKSFTNLEKLAIGHFKKREIGDQIYRLSYDVWALGDLIEQGLIPATTNALYLLTTVVILFFIHPQLALISLAMIPVLTLGLIIFNKSQVKATKLSEQSNSSLFSFIQEILSQLKTIQAYNQQKREAGVFEEKEDTSLSNDLRVFGYGILLNLFIGTVIAVGYSVVILVGIRAVFAETITTGLLVVFLFYLDNLTNPLLNFLSSIGTLKESYIKVSRMKDFFDKKTQTPDRGTKTNPENQNIKYDKVTVVGDGNYPILKEVTLEIPQNKKTIIVGVSGSGKTTIASVLLRFTSIASGKVLLGNKDIESYSLKALRDSISYVPQEVVLFDDTIYNNILFGKQTATYNEVKKAVKLAAADDFINSLPEKYEFKVGEEGINLSGGQRQRIMLARALLKKEAPILLFDEPLSSLDVETRRKVMKNIEKFCEGKTTIIISNVVDVIKKADKIIVINNGEVLHEGKNLDLLKSLI